MQLTEKAEYFPCGSHLPPDEDSTTFPALHDYYNKKVTLLKYSVPPITEMPLKTQKSFLFSLVKTSSAAIFPNFSYISRQFASPTCSITCSLCHKKLTLKMFTSLFPSHLSLTHFVLHGADVYYSSIFLISSSRFVLCIRRLTRFSSLFRARNTRNI